MADSFATIPGIPIGPEELQISKAKIVVDILLSRTIAFVELIECRYEASDHSRWETVVFDVEIEVPQHKVHNILPIERIAVIFTSLDVSHPEVLALRVDFPKVPHINLRSQEIPRSLCLYDESHDEIQLNWTAAGFLERIREWLALTACGKLHGEDQPLEPLLMGMDYKLIIPEDWLLETLQSDSPVPLQLRGVKNEQGGLVILTETDTERVHQQQDGVACVATIIKGEPQTHGVIAHTPETLGEVDDFLKAANINLVEMLQDRLCDWLRYDNQTDILACKLIVIVILPKRRADTVKAEISDLWAFMSAVSVRDVGLALDVWQVFDDKIGSVVHPSVEKRGDDIAVLTLNPTMSFSHRRAAQLSGIEDQSDIKIVAIGLGALGSHLFLNLLRMGYGKWILIDDDYLLPHNLARHVLDGCYLGLPKVESLRFSAFTITKDIDVAQAITANVMHPRDHKEEVVKVLAEADVILDCSASVPVGRYLIHRSESSARRVSFFFNPSGSDGVVLAEDIQREITLDMLEMQYYRYILHDSDYEYHLQSANEHVRYARSCRDLSTTIPQDIVALHASMGSRVLRTVLQKEHGHIVLWRTIDGVFDVQSKSIVPYPVLKQSVSSWLICTDQWVIDTMIRLRTQKLPNETGGVLIGTFDMQHQVIYIVDIIPSPTDSIEWPTSYIRGTQDLRDQIERAEQVTAGQLTYVGEWHSHPQGHGCMLSDTDRQALQMLADERQRDGYKALMAIIGDDGQYAWYIM